MNRLKALPVMQLTIDKSLMTYFMNFGIGQELYSNMWFIEGPKEKIIVDTGADAKTIASHGFPSKQINYPDEALAKVGLTFDDIDILILTQMHLDHVEYARLFKKAKIIVQKKEYDFAMNPHPLWAGIYIKDMFEDLKNIELVEGDTEIANGVSVLFTPGHTPGGQSVMINSSRGKVILCGLCTVKENLYPPAELQDLMPIVTPGIHVDTMQAYDSMVRIKKTADIAVPLHDYEFTFKDSIPF